MSLIVKHDRNDGGGEGRWVREESEEGQRGERGGTLIAAGSSNQLAVKSDITVNWWIEPAVMPGALITTG